MLPEGNFQHFHILYQGSMTPSGRKKIRQVTYKQKFALVYRKYKNLIDLLGILRWLVWPVLWRKVGWQEKQGGQWRRW